MTADDGFDGGLEVGVGVGLIHLEMQVDRHPRPPGWAPFSATERSESRRGTWA